MDLLAAAQREVGQRWYCNELTSADEHLASGVSAAALDTLMGETSEPPATASPWSPARRVTSIRWPRRCSASCCASMG